MLLVDISVPAVDKTYNFKLNEEVEISSIIGEIVDMIARKEQTSLRGEEGKSEQELAGELSLYYVSRQQVLPRNSTLAECGIPVGSLLMLV